MVAEKRAFKGTFAARLPRGDGGIEEERGEGKTQDSNLRTLERRAKHKCKSISKIRNYYSESLVSFLSVECSRL